MKVLIIGGTAYTSRVVVDYLEKNNYIVDLMTYRQENRIYGNYNWQHLDLENNDNVLDFINKIPKNYYSKIILMPGNATGTAFDDISYEDLKKYYESYSFNYILLLTKLMDSITEYGQIISISSIAANLAINDIHYSAVKAAVQACVKSLSLYVKENQSIFSISPGTIFEETKHTIAQTIIDSDKTYNGKVIEIGY